MVKYKRPCGRVILILERSCSHNCNFITTRRKHKYNSDTLSLSQVLGTWVSGRIVDQLDWDLAIRGGSKIVHVSG